MGLSIIGRWKKTKEPKIWSVCPAEDIRIVVAGHSHLTSIAAAIHHVDTKSLAAANGVAAYGFSQPEADYWEAIYKAARRKVLVISYKGNQHNEFLFAIGQKFDFHLPPFPIVEERLVPLELVREHLLQSAEGLGEILRQAKKSGARVIVAGTPPPRGNDGDIRTKIESEAALLSVVKAFRLTAESVPISALSVRLKLWTVLQQIYAQQAENNGAEFFPFPAETQSDDGSLDPKYWSRDVTHSNVACGAVWLKNFLQWEQRGRASI